MRKSSLVFLIRRRYLSKLAYVLTSNPVQQRKAYCYSEVNQNSIKENKHKLHKEMLAIPSTSIENTWILFKRYITSLINKHIPSKMLKGQKVGKLWIEKKSESCNQKEGQAIHENKPASVAQLDAPSDWRPGGRGFNPRRGRQHSFVEIDHEIFSTVILSLPLIQEGQLSVSGERMCTIQVNRLDD